MTIIPDDLTTFLNEQRDVHEYRRALAVKLALQGYTYDTISDIGEEIRGYSIPSGVGKGGVGEAPTQKPIHFPNHLGMLYLEGVNMGKPRDEWPIMKTIGWALRPLT